MTTAQIRIGIVVILAQLILLGMKLGFNSAMDRAAERDGIATIIQGAAR